MRQPKVVASIEARMGASRLPGKMLKDINGKPAITRVIERVKKIKRVDEIIVATTDSLADSVIEEVALKEGVKVYRGSEDDVLLRVVDAHRTVNSDVVVEICGDCPLLDPTIADELITIYHNNNYDVVECGVKQSYPQGTEVQVFSFEKLKEIETLAQDIPYREHVSLYFYEHEDQYNIYHHVAPKDLQWPDLRLQLDYQEDYELICTIYEALETKHNNSFELKDVLQLLREQPKLQNINTHCVEKAVR